LYYKEKYNKNAINSLNLTLLYNYKEYIYNNLHKTIYIFRNSRKVWLLTKKILTLQPKTYQDIYCMPNIKKKIKELGFTAQQIAEKLNISQQAVSQAINGNPSLSRLEQIASAIGIPVSELVADNPASRIESQIHCPYCGHDLKIDLK